MSQKPQQKHDKDKKGEKKTPLEKMKQDYGVNQQFGIQVVLTILIFLALLGGYSSLKDAFKKPENVTLSQLAQDMSERKVSKIVVRGEQIDITYGVDKDAVIKYGKKEGHSGLTETLKNYGATPEDMRAVPIEIADPTGFKYWMSMFLPLLGPILLIAFGLWFFTRQIRGAGMQAFTFGQSRARMIDPNDKNNRVTFADVAGSKVAKQELNEIVEFLKSPEKFLAIGAKIPKGVMLMGGPGTGKTLLARAVAGEAGVPFYSISGSEFVEMFVGVGASRVRDLFDTAKKNAPAIVFVDEIDAVGRARGTGMGGGNDEREQTLNQILVEMDGFEPTEKVIVIAATNRPDVLDPALLRPGRFDRRVMIDPPDRAEREEILVVHARKKPLHADVNLVEISKRTPGFSGADLANLMNEAAILAAREDRKELTQYDLLRSIEKVMLGPERKSHIMNAEEKKITAYHEAGHAIVASVLEYSDPVHKVSVISRGRAAGYTLKLPDTDRRMQSKKEFLDDIAVSLAGYVTERMIFGDLTTGPSNDLQVSTSLARNMVTRWGMSDTIGPVALEDDGGRVIIGSHGMPSKEYSENVSALIDSEVKKIIAEQLTRAEETIVRHRQALDAVAQKLIDVETLERDEYEAVVKENGITLKDKKGVVPMPKEIVS
jgi:cell division protease FtsH